MPVHWNVGPSLLVWDEDVGPTIGFKLIWALVYAGSQGKRLLSGAIYKKGLGQLVAHSSILPFPSAWVDRRTRMRRDVPGGS